MRLSDPAEKFIPKRVDWLKHDYLGGSYNCVILAWLFISLALIKWLKIMPAIYALYGSIMLYLIWAILTAYNEYHQGKTGTGEKSVKDWLYGMRNPTIGMGLLVLMYSIFS